MAHSGDEKARMRSDMDRIHIVMSYCESHNRVHRFAVFG
jgi:hypothetical protein